MRQAIVTKYLGPTNHRAARVKASAQAGSVTVSWDHALGISENHIAAAKAFAEKYQWVGSWVGGGLPNNEGYCFVTADGFPQLPAFKVYE